jgi:hypothetical protein
MNKVLAVLAGAGVGALVMYLFDPNGGGRRRALIRDKAVGLSNDAKQAFNKTTTDLSNRAQGLAHEAKSLISGGSPSSSNVSTERPT